MIFYESVWDRINRFVDNKKAEDVPIYACLDGNLKQYYIEYIYYGYTKMLVYFDYSHCSKGELYESIENFFNRGIILTKPKNAIIVTNKIRGKCCRKYQEQQFGCSICS